MLLLPNPKGPAIPFTGPFELQGCREVNKDPANRDKDYRQAQQAQSNHPDCYNIFHDNLSPVIKLTGTELGK